MPYNLFKATEIYLERLREKYHVRMESVLEKIIKGGHCR
jgi:hypothetical protein